MSPICSRRAFIQTAAAGTIATVLPGLARQAQAQDAACFALALDADSLLRSVGTEAEQIPMLALPRVAREQFELNALVLNYQQFASVDSAYVDALAAAARQHRVRIAAIHVEGAGDLGPAAEPHRTGILRNHQAWVDIAQRLNCPAIRVVWRNYPVTVWRRPDDLKAFIEDSAPIFRDLADYAETKGSSIYVTNDRGPSAYPDSLVSLVTRVNHPRFAMMPDVRGWARGIDRYDAMEKVMPYTRAITARCYDFDDVTGEDTTVDYGRMLALICGTHAFSGTVAVHYAGSRVSEAEGIRAARDLLLTERRTLIQNKNSDKGAA